MATHYIDPAATSGGHDGSSWSDAWLNFGQVAGLLGGDTVYLSGGVAGGQRNYALNNPWNPVGAAGNRVTYQIGQDAQHNGTAIFTNTGAGNAIGYATNVNLIGDAGDGQPHFRIQGFSTAIDGGTSQSTNYRLAYISVPTCNEAVKFDNGNGIEIDHCSFIVSTTHSDHAILWNQMVGGGYDVNKFHDNTIDVPRESVGGGSDHFQVSGNGVSFYSNRCITHLGYISLPPPNQNQHQDGWQCLGGSTYLKVYNNEFVNIANYPIYPTCNFGGYINILIYNNLMRWTDQALAATAPPRGIVMQSGIDDGLIHSINHMLVANNLVVDLPNRTAIEIDNPFSSTLSLNDVRVINNYGINSGGMALGGPGTSGTIVQSNNYFALSSAQAATRVKSYTAFGAGNDYHLLAGAVELVDKGLNLNSDFSVDKDGNSRPSVWDIGPYELSGGGGGGTASLTVDKTSLDFGIVQVGANPTLNVIVGNSGTASTGQQTASISSPFVIVSGGTYNLAPGQFQTIQVRYATLVKGIHSGTLTLAGGQGALVSLSGKSYPLSSSLSFNPDDGLVMLPFVVDASAHTVSQPSQITNPSQAGQMRIAFTAPSDGVYSVTALVNAPGDSSNSFYVGIDTLPVEPTNVWDIMPFTTGYQSRTASWRGTGDFQNPQFNPKTWTLTANTVYQLIICGREANVGLGAITINAPSNTPVIPDAPAAPALTTPADGATNQSLTPVLSWTESDMVSGFSVYFGTTNPPAKVMDLPSTTLSYSPSTLAYSTVYYWKVRSFLNWSSQGQNGQVMSESAVRSFTTLAQPVTLPPTVVMTSPAEGTIYTAPATIDFAASATAGTNPIAKVEFYINASKVGEDTTAPYTYSQGSVTAGPKILLAKALDNQGSPLSANSQSVNVFVLAPDTHAVPNVIYVT